MRLIEWKHILNRYQINRWNKHQMLADGQSLFPKIYQKKRLAHENHDIHFLSRNLANWLPQGINHLMDGSYSPRMIKRHYFPDETVDMLHLSDRVLQNLLLKQIKSTFQHMINPRCYHLLHGPHGVKVATREIQKALASGEYRYVIRADIKGYYASIPHFKLIQDIKGLYDDPKLIAMLSRVITNPMETPKGFRNPSFGIPVRGPLSMFFSAVYLKKLDDAFDGCDVKYLRYNDDIVILCKSKKQMVRCRRKMMAVLQERLLGLARKKTRMGCLSKGFHFCGVDYPGTRILGGIDGVSAAGDAGGAVGVPLHKVGPRWCLHARTVRRARERIKFMVVDGLMPKEIVVYLVRWARWWGFLDGGNKGPQMTHQLAGLIVQVVGASAVALVPWH